MTEAEFVKEVTDGLQPPPGYFGMNVAMNKKGYESFEEVLHHGMRKLSANEFEAEAEETEALILDTRKDADFAKEFIPRAINIGLSGDFAPWVGAMIADVRQPLLLVTDPGKEEEAVTRLSRVGFDNVRGFLNGGYSTWHTSPKEKDTINRISAAEFAKNVKVGVDEVIDVRKQTEYEAEHVQDAVNRPLNFINDWIKDINPEKHFYLHCAGGYRSMIAASILYSRGFRNFTEIAGGFNAIASTGVPVSDFVCQSKLMK